MKLSLVALAALSSVAHAHPGHGVERASSGAPGMLWLLIVVALGVLAGAWLVERRRS